MGKVWLSNSAASCRALTFDSRLARVFHRILADHRNGQRHCRFLAQVRASVGGGRYASRQFPHHRIGVQFHLHRPRVHERCGDGCCLFTCCDTRAIDHELSGKRRHPLPSGMGKDRRSGRSRVADAPRHQSPHVSDARAGRVPQSAVWRRAVRFASIDRGTPNQIVTIGLACRAAQVLGSQYLCRQQLDGLLAEPWPKD
jgi:plasmid stabilization system protein ParE